MTLYTLDKYILLRVVDTTIAKDFNCHNYSLNKCFIDPSDDSRDDAS